MILFPVWYQQQIDFSTLPICTNYNKIMMIINTDINATLQSKVQWHLKYYTWQSTSYVIHVHKFKFMHNCTYDSIFDFPINSITISPSRLVLVLLMHACSYELRHEEPSASVSYTVCTVSNKFQLAFSYCFIDWNWNSKLLGIKRWNCFSFSPVLSRKSRMNQGFFLYFPSSNNLNRIKAQEAFVPLIYVDVLKKWRKKKQYGEEECLLTRMNAAKSLFSCWVVLTGSSQVLVVARDD